MGLQYERPWRKCQRKSWPLELIYSHCLISFFNVLSKNNDLGFGCCPLKGGGSVVVDLLLIVTPIVGVCNCSRFCCSLLCVHSSIAIILMGKRELVALLNFSSWCFVMVERLFLAVPRGCLRFVIVVFPDHTHLLFSTVLKNEPFKRKIPINCIRMQIWPWH